MPRHTRQRLVAMGHERARPAHAAVGRHMPRAALAAIGTSIMLMVLLGAQGPMAGATLPNLLAGPTFPAAPPWPPWFVHGHPSRHWSVTLWLVESLGGPAWPSGWWPSARVAA